MAGRLSIMGLLLIFISSSKCQVNLPDLPLEDIYMCNGEDKNISCPFGYVVEVQNDIKIGIIRAGCSPDTVKDVGKDCIADVAALSIWFQQNGCRNKTSCKIYDETGKPFSCGGVSNFMLVPIICRFVGYEGMTSPLTTTSSTSKPVTAQSTAIKSTVTSKGVTVKSTVESTSNSSSQLSSDVTLSGASVTSISTGNQTDIPITTSSPAAGAAQSYQEKLSSSEKKLIIGVSVSAVGLILIIILLVECKRQMRQKRKNESDSIGKSVEEADSKEPDGPSTTEHAIDVDEEIAIINKEPERRFRKKNEREHVYDNLAIVAPVAKHAAIPDELKSTGSVHSGRDSGVSALYSEEGLAEAPSAESPEHEEEPEAHEQPKPVRKVTFNDQEMNTDMTAIVKGADPARSSPTSPSNSKSVARPAVDRSISGPGSETEVLY